MLIDYGGSSFNVIKNVNTNVNRNNNILNVDVNNVGPNTLPPIQAGWCAS